MAVRRRPLLVVGEAPARSAPGEALGPGSATGRRLAALLAGRPYGAVNLLDAGQGWSVPLAVLRVRTDLFFARDLISTKQRLDEGEELDMVCLPVAEVLEMILRGEVIDGSLQLGVLLAEKKGLLPPGSSHGIS